MSPPFSEASFGGFSTVSDVPDWNNVLDALVEEEKPDSQTLINEFRRTAQVQEEQLAARLSEERKTREAECIRRSQVALKLSKRVLDLRKVERILAKKKEYAEANRVKSEADAVERQERAKHQAEITRRLAKLNDELMMKEEESARNLQKRLYEKIWQLALANKVPLQELRHVCAVP